MTTVITLADALTLGEGIERPFCCPEHDDHEASASVNVLKGLWVCYACHAAGTADGKKVPTAAQLLSMVEPEQAVREYPEDWLALFDDPVHWAQRFNPETCWALRLGEDPFTGDATFPVRTPAGRLAGIGRRIENPEEKQPRYRYPQRWSASRVLGCTDQPNTDPVLVLVEGYGDAAACWEVGCRTLCCYGAGLHLPQLELIRRINPRLILLGFDMDDAGERATARAFTALEDQFQLAQVVWLDKDPAASPPEERLAALGVAVKSVSASAYVEIAEGWNDTTIGIAHAYMEHEKELV